MFKGCLYPDSTCRYCFFSADPNLFDPGCTLQFPDELFERWAAEQQFRKGPEWDEHIAALRCFRRWEHLRDVYDKKRGNRR